jgi:peroxiredoxin Q/BCP
MTKKSSSFKTHQSQLKEGDKAPGFEGTYQHGNRIRLSDFSGKNLVLYFYPKDNTPTCTLQACSLRDEFKELTKAKYEIVGVSADSQKMHAKFADKYQLPYSLLADEEMKTIKAYDVWGTKMLFGRVYEGIVRTSFVINEKGVIRSIIRDVDAKGHARQILEL